MFDRRLISNFDWVLLLVIIVIGMLGIITVYSSGYGRPDTQLGAAYIKQIYWFVLGLIGMLTVILMDYDYLEKYAYVFYLLMLAVLAYLLVFGKIVAGTQRWISLGPVTFQPSELMKLVLIMTLAKYFSNRKKADALRLRELFIPFIIVFIPQKPLLFNLNELIEYSGRGFAK